MTGLIFFRLFQTPTTDSRSADGEAFTVRELRERELVVGLLAALRELCAREERRGLGSTLRPEG